MSIGCRAQGQVTTAGPTASTWTMNAADQDTSLRSSSAEPETASGDQTGSVAKQTPLTVTRPSSHTPNGSMRGTTDGHRHGDNRSGQHRSSPRLGRGRRRVLDRERRQIRPPARSPATTRPSSRPRRSGRTTGCSTSVAAPARPPGWRRGSRRASGPPSGWTCPRACSTRLGGERPPRGWRMLVFEQVDAQTQGSPTRGSFRESYGSALRNI